MAYLLNIESSAIIGRPAPKARDRGSALIMAAIVSVVVFALGGVVLSFANHQSSASNNDRMRQRSVDAAMAGLVVADAALTNVGVYADSGVLNTLASGEAQFRVTVDASVPGRRVLNSVGYAPSAAASPRSVRTMRQEVQADPVGVSYAMFSLDPILKEPNWSVIGSIYTVGGISLKNTDIHGDIYTEGTITTQRKVTGSLYANIDINAPSGATGGAYAGGSITSCANVTPCLSHLVPLPVLPQTLPEFPWPNPKYPTYSTPTSAAFTTLATASAGAKGVFYINDNVTFSKQDTIVLTGDMVIVSTGDVALPGGVTGPDNVKVQLTVISTCSLLPTRTRCYPGSSGTIAAPNPQKAWGLGVRTLLYTKGMFDGKNAIHFTGAIYAGNIDAHANINVEYPAEPVTATGFDWSNGNRPALAIRHISTREINNITP